MRCGAVGCAMAMYPTRGPVKFTVAAPYKETADPIDGKITRAYEASESSVYVQIHNEAGFVSTQTLDALPTGWTHSAYAAGMPITLIVDTKVYPLAPGRWTVKTIGTGVSTVDGARPEASCDVGGLADAIAKLDRLARVLQSEPGVPGGYNAATGLLTIREATSSEWTIDNWVGMPSQISLIIGGVLYDSDDYFGDFDAWMATIRALETVQSIDGGGGYPLVITAVPGVDVLTVTDLVVTGGTADLTQTATGAFVDVAWVQYYADKECTTPHAGSMGTAAGKLGLTAAP